MSKEQFRKSCLKKLRAIPKFNRVYKEKTLLNKLDNLLRYLEVKNSLFYWPMGSEVDVRSLIHSRRKKGDVYLPFMQDHSFKMVTFRFPLYRKNFGIYEAGNSYKKIKKVDVVIVPIVGVDGDRRRIGFGKGMYDRFFAQLKYNPIQIFIQPQMCYTKKHVGDDYDIQADYLLTPQGCYKTQQRTKDDKRTAFKRIYCNNRYGCRFDNRFSHRKKNRRI